MRAIYVTVAAATIIVRVSYIVIPILATIVDIYDSTCKVAELGAAPAEVALAASACADARWPVCKNAPWIVVSIRVATDFLFEVSD